MVVWAEPTPPWSSHCTPNQGYFNTLLGLS
jgi:hypothetical protein